MVVDIKKFFKYIFKRKIKQYLLAYFTAIHKQSYKSFYLRPFEIISITPVNSKFNITRVKQP